MDFGILRALQTLKNHPYVQYVGLGFAGLVQTGAQDAEVGYVSYEEGGEVGERGGGGGEGRGPEASP